MSDMTNRVSKVRDSCKESLKRIESSIGVYSIGKQGSIAEADIDVFLVAMKKHRESLTDDDISRTLINVNNHLATLTYISSYASFHRLAILDFSTHARVDFLATFIYPYLVRENIVKGVQKASYNVIKYLQVLEASHKDITKTLNYRYIRLFLYFAESGNLFAASLLTRFLLDQIFISNAVDNSVNIKLSELSSAANKLKKMAKQYKKSVGTHSTSKSSRGGNLLKKQTTYESPKTSNCNSYEEYESAKAAGEIKRDKSAYQSIDRSGLFS